MREKIVLSKRLEAIAAMVSAGNSVCDVGCDHGFVPIYLVQQGIAPKAVAMDVKEGPLEQAGEHIAAYGMQEYITLRRSDGLLQYRIGEADSLICAGMGGRLMMRILEECPEKAASFQELILQPQSDIEQFRAFLRRQDYLFVDENMIEEDGKFYPMMRVVPKEREHFKTRTALSGTEAGKVMEHGITEPETVTCGESYLAKLGQTWDSQDLQGVIIHDSIWKQRMEDRYGALLLARKHPVLYRYLEREKRICEEILEELRRQGVQEPNALRQKKRYEEVQEQLLDCMRVMKLY